MKTNTDKLSPKLTETPTNTSSPQWNFRRLCLVFAKDKYVAINKNHLKAESIIKEHQRLLSTYNQHDGSDEAPGHFPDDRGSRTEHKVCILAEVLQAINPHDADHFENAIQEGCSSDAVVIQ